MISNCCCCIPLRTGIIILSIVGILFGVGFLLLGQSWFNIVLAVTYFLEYGVLLHGAINSNRKTLLVCVIVDAIMIIFRLISYNLVLAGIIPFGNTKAIGINYKCQQEQEVVVDILHEMGGNNGKLSPIEVKFGGIDIAAEQSAAIFFIFAMINSYNWLCIYSFYKDIRLINGYIV